MHADSFVPFLCLCFLIPSFPRCQDALSGDALAWAILAGGAIAAATTVVNKRRKARMPVTAVDTSLSAAPLPHTTADAPAAPRTHSHSHTPTHAHAPMHSQVPDYSDSHFSAISVMHDGPIASFAHGPSGPFQGSGSVGHHHRHLPPHLLARPSASWSAPHHSSSGSRRGHKSRDRERDKDRHRSKGTSVAEAAVASPSSSRPLPGEKGLLSLVVSTM